MKKLALVLPAILLLIITSAGVYAKDGNHNSGDIERRRTEIKIDKDSQRGQGQGRFEFEDDERPLSVGTTAGSNIRIRVKINGAIQQAQAFLSQILALLQRFIS